MKSVAAAVALLFGCSGLFIAPASAAVITLGDSGWTASWDSSLDPYLSLSVDYVDQEIVVIEKFARFVDSPVDGQFQTVSITFQQTHPDAVPYIVINDEIVENLTGEEWNGFIFSIDGPDVHFDTARTSIGANGGFDILPFTSFVYGNDDATLTLGDGVISSVSPVTNLWTPGMAGGALWIAANPANGDQQPRSFTLNEQPLPEPASLGALALAGLLIIRRRAR